MICHIGAKFFGCNVTIITTTVAVAAYLSCKSGVRDYKISIITIYHEVHLFGKWSNPAITKSHDPINKNNDWTKNNSYLIKININSIKKTMNPIKNKKNSILILNRSVLKI